MKIDWSKIQSPETFEALCSAILAFEDETAEIFTRPGADFAIDAISQTNQTVYQFKYHRSPKSSQHIDDAKAELKKIKKILSKNGNAKNIWQKINKWVLVTNNQLNPNQGIEKWQDVKQEYGKIDIDAVLWSAETLEKLLRKHKPVLSEFFTQEVRPYLTLKEAKLLLEETSFRKNEYSSKYFGRENELKILEEFLKEESKRVLLVHGPGGTGKTRFLLEAGDKSEFLKQERAYWANTATLESDKSFHGGIIPETSHTILIDEPEDISFLKVLLEQISLPNSRISKWKVIISTRDQNKKVKSIFDKYKLNKSFSDISLDPIDKVPFSKLIENQIEATNINLSSGEKATLKKKLVALSNGYPIWVHIALSLLEQGESMVSLPEDQFKVADKYITQTIDNVPKKIGTVNTISSLIRWISLYGEVSLKDEKLLDFVSKQVTNDESLVVSSQIDFLLSVGLAKKFGSLVKIKPDVIRDSVQLTSLAKDLSSTPVELSDFGIKIKELMGNALKGLEVPQLPKLIKNLSYVDLYTTHFKSNKVGVLKEFVNDIVQSARKGSVSDQEAIVKIAENFAASSPEAIIEIVNAVLANEGESMEIEVPGFGKHKIEYDDVVRKLPNLILETSRYLVDEATRKDIVRLIVRLLRIECKDMNDSNQYKYNDGRSVVENLISGGPGFLMPYQSDFEDIAIEEIKQLEADLRENPYFYKHLISPLISLRRGHSVFENGAVVISRYFIKPKSKAYESRIKILEQIWNSLKESTPINSRVLLFNLIGKAHRDLHNAFADSGVKAFEEEELKTLERLHSLIQKPWINRTDLREARSIWDWHYSYDKRENVKQAATKCENVFLQSPDSEVFEEIFQWKYERNKDDKVLIKKHCENLISVEDGTLINKFIKDGMEFAGDEKFWHGVYDVFNNLLPNYETKAVLTFIDRELYSDDTNIRGFAQRLLALHVCDLRKKGKHTEAIDLIQNAVSRGPDEKLNVSLLITAYLEPHLSRLGVLSKDEYHLIYDYEDIFKSAEQEIYFVQAITNFFYVDIEKFKGKIDRILETSNSEFAGQVIVRLINTLQLINNVGDRFGVTLPKNIVKWVFLKLQQIPDTEKVKGDVVDYNLNELLKYAEWRPNIKDFKDFLFERIRLSKTQKNSEFDVMPGITFDIIKFFKKLPDDSLSNEEALGSLKALLTLNDEDYPVGYHIHEWLYKFDVNGKYLPDLINEKIGGLDSNEDPNDIYMWSRYAGIYQENTEPWRKIALKVGAKFNHYTGERRKEVLRSLAHHYHYSEVWSGAYGEFHSRWQNAVDLQKENLDNESEPFLKEFFKLCLDYAEHELERALERFEEEHGDE